MFPSSSSSPQGVVGAYAGAGVGFFATNANNANELSGPFNTISINTPFGSLQIGWDNSGTVITSGMIGPGAGFGISTYPTNTEHTWSSNEKKPPSVAGGGYTIGGLPGKVVTPVAPYIGNQR